MQHGEVANHQDVIEISDARKLSAKPIVSVVMLAYGHEEYLTDAIEGVLLQNVDFPLELIIAEDCSPDGTMAIAKRYQQAHPELIRILCSSANVGATENGARAIAACRGEFITYCEGDDYWHHPDKLRRQVEIFRSNPEVTLVHTAWNHRITWCGKDRILVPRGVSPAGTVTIEHDAFQTLRSWESFVMTCTAMIRSSVSNAYRASVDWRKFQVGDWPQFTFCAAVGEIAYLNLSTATYRRVSGSVMNSNAAAHVARVRNALVIHEELRRALGPRYDEGWSRDQVMARHLYDVATTYHDVDTLSEARELLLSTGVEMSPVRIAWDLARTRWPAVGHLSQAWPNAVELLRKMVRYRAVPVHDVPCFVPDQG